MNFGITLHITGDYALFSRPEMKVERVSYDVITPSAARGILEAIYWKPQIRWVIDELHVLKPIRFTNVRRNEVGAKVSVKGKSGINKAMTDPTCIPNMDVTTNRQQRASLLLKDVGYLIKAHIDVLDDQAIGKHLDMFKRRARKGQHFHQPYFGCREFPVRFDLIENEADLPASELPENDSTKDLGFMLHDIEFDQDPETKKVRDTTPHFFRASMSNGVITVPKLPF
jgi:CRISPR-associated protein Cas5d